MRIREMKKDLPKPRDPNAKAMQDLRKSGASGSHGDKTKVIPRKQKHKDKDMKEGRDTHCSDKCCGSDVKREDCTCSPTCKHCNCNAKMETATPGATSAGNIATVANPHIANSKAKPKKQKPTDNALDNKSHGLFGQPLKRLNNSKEVTMDKDTELKENLADMASKVEQDHEVQMARAQLYKIAKYSIKMHEMLKNVSEQEGLEGWVQSKITKAADYMGAVYHNMDYEQKFEEVSESINEAKACNCNEDCACGGNCQPDCNCGPNCNESVTEGKAKNPKQQAAIAIAKKKDGYKESLADKLDAKISEKSKGLYYNVNKRKKAGTSRKKGHPKAPTKQDWENAAKTAKESSIEEKQKGVDGKACWDGYKRMGTKKKGGKTVDNCVKMQFHES